MEYTNAKISVRYTTFHVPHWIVHDVGNFYPKIFKHILYENAEYVEFPIEYLHKFIQFRKQTYYACNWYPELASSNIPTIKSTILCTDNDYQKMDDLLKQHLHNTKFIRFCNASPKDITLPMFSKNDNIIDIFKTSNRTAHMMHSCHKTHLMIRDVINIDYEVRCFWHRDTLRAISGPLCYVTPDVQKHIMHIVDNFFATYGDDIIYDSCTIDLGITANDAYIIEFNSFGCDAWASAELFDWIDDFEILHNSQIPFYRFKNEFAW